MTTSAESYWIVAVPNNASSGSAAKARSPEEEARLTRRQLDMRTQKLSDNFEFRIPRLKVGTLDALMSLSDELGKIDNTIEAVLKKVKRTHIEHKGKESDLLVTNDEKGGASVPPHAYIEKWDWNAAKFPVVASLKDLTTKIQQSVLAVDEELRRRTSKLAEINTAVQTIERKETGSLLVKPLGAFVKPADVIDREYITTLLVVVPKAKEEEFESTYELLEEMAAHEKAEKEKEEAQRRAESGKNAAPASASSTGASGHKPAPAPAAAGAHAPPPHDAPASHKLTAVEQAELDAQVVARQLKEEEDKKTHDAELRRKARENMCKNVVPRSSRKLYSDGEYTIYRILVFKKGADTIKNLCREKRYTVRPYDYDPNAEKAEQERKVQLIADRNKLQAAVSGWLVSKFSEVMIGWMHIKAIRTFTESVLRFGIPINFQAVILKARKGAHAKLRLTLAELYSSLAGGNLAMTADEQSSDLAGLTGGEFFPYVYLPLDLQDE